MRKALALVLSAGVVLAWLLPGGLREATREGVAEASGLQLGRALQELLEERQFAKKVAGVWYAGAPGDVPQTLAVLSIGGSYVDNDENDFLNRPEVPFHSTSVGEWTRSGDMEITINAVEYVWDANGDLHGIYKVTAVGTLSEDFNTLLGTYCQLKWGPPGGPDPNLDEPVPPEEAGEPAPFFARRLTSLTCQ